MKPFKEMYTDVDQIKADVKPEWDKCGRTKFDDGRIHGFHSHHLEEVSKDTLTHISHLYAYKWCKEYLY